MKNDFNGNGNADILVTSPWGLGLLSLEQNDIVVQSMSSNGTRFAGWLLNTSDNNMEMKADLDGDGRSEVLISSPWGIGILKLINGNFTAIAMAANGTRHGGWIINTADNQFLYAADFNGDGKEEILVTSPWGIGILQYSNYDITSLMLQPNGTRFGGWLLNTADNFFSLVGDFDGDGTTEILVSSPWGIGILKFDGASLFSVFMAENGSYLGEWGLDTTRDRFEVVGDFDGDGRAEILVSNDSKMSVLKLENNWLTTVGVAFSGDYVGSYLLDTRNTKMGCVGDLDGDGKTEIVMTNNWGLAVLKLNGPVFETIMTAANGTRFGGWLLNTKDNRLNYLSDFNGDGRAEILITSPWGVGILAFVGNNLFPINMYPNGSRFGGWLLNTVDNDFEAGIGQSYGLIVYHTDWQSAVDNTTAFLRNRGYTMFVLPNGPDGITILKRLSVNLKPADRLFVYIAGHGDSPNRQLNNTDKNVSLTHRLQFLDGSLVNYEDFAMPFQLMGNKGVDLTVLDGSCDGGEAVLAAMGERYLAMSTTSVFAPGLTNTPDPSATMQFFGKESKFGLWWSQYSAASLLTSITPHRFFQKIYRNDDTEISTLSLFYKPAINFYPSLGGGWDLLVRYCYLYRYIFPDEYNALDQARKDQQTVSAQDFLTSMRNDFNSLNPYVNQLRNILNNSALVNNAAYVYAAAFPKPWQTLFGDMNWDVAADPARHSSLNNALVPGYYQGTEGFISMVKEILDMLGWLEQSYYDQETLLTHIDAEIRHLSLYTGIFKGQPIAEKKITDYLKFNEYEQKKALQQAVVLNSANLEKNNFYKMDLPTATYLDGLKVVSKFIDVNNVIILKRHYLDNLYEGESLNDLIAEFKSITANDSIYIDKLFYLLIIVEEAISKVQATGVEQGDLVSF